MRTVEIKAGPIDVRVDTAAHRVCLVFEARDGSVRLFRLMPIAEARAFHEHFGRQIQGGE